MLAFRTRPALAALALSCSLATLAGCASGGGSATPKPYDPEALTFAPSLGVDLSAMQKTPAGLYFQDLKVGEGSTAQRSSTVTVRYVGYLADGKVFDAATADARYECRLGAGTVIRGWDLGIPGMKVGGLRRLVIRPSLGYRGQATGPIPANSTLIFDIELMDVH